jgi:alpha-tubulin suppressor-like RCC1 family protein
LSLSSEPGELFTWGNNDFGQLGRSGRQFAAQRVEALETMRIVQVAAGGTASTPRHDHT